MLSPYPGYGKPQRFDREHATAIRRLHGEPEPFSEEFQERFLQTLLLDSEFALAVRAALESVGGDR